MSGQLKTAVAIPWKKQKRVGVKKFLWTDKSGRGITNTFNQTEVKKNFRGEFSWQGVSAYYYALDAEVGEEWENAAHKIVRVK